MEPQPNPDLQAFSADSSESSPLYPKKHPGSPPRAPRPYDKMPITHPGLSPLFIIGRQYSKDRSSKVTDSKGTEVTPGFQSLNLTLGSFRHGTGKSHAFVIDSPRHSQSSKMIRKTPDNAKSGSFGLDEILNNGVERQLQSENRSSKITINKTLHKLDKSVMSITKRVVQSRTGFLE